MATGNKLHWRKSDRETITKLVRKFNAKLTREAKKNPEAAPFLPKRLNAQALAEDLRQGSRYNFNKVVKSYERFMRKDAAKMVQSKTGIIVTKWQKQEVQYKLRTINRNKAKERERLNVSTEKGTMGTIKANNLRPKVFHFDDISPQGWEKFVESVEKQAREDYAEKGWIQYKDNFIAGLKHAFNSVADPVIDYLESTDLEHFKMIMDEQDPDLEISFVYSPEEAYFKVITIAEALNRHGANIDMDQFDDFIFDYMMTDVD